jgi:hypothetical protein
VVVRNSMIKALRVKKVRQLYITTCYAPSPAMAEVGAGGRQRTLRLTRHSHPFWGDGLPMLWLISYGYGIWLGLG